MKLYLYIIMLIMSIGIVSSANYTQSVSYNVLGSQAWSQYGGVELYTLKDNLNITFLGVIPTDTATETYVLNSTYGIICIIPTETATSCILPTADRYVIIEGDHSNSHTEVYATGNNAYETDGTSVNITNGANNCNIRVDFPLTIGQLWNYDTKCTIGALTGGANVRNFDRIELRDYNPIPQSPTNITFTYPLCNETYPIGTGTSLNVTWTSASSDYTFNILYNLSRDTIIPVSSSNLTYSVISTSSFTHGTHVFNMKVIDTDNNLYNYSTSCSIDFCKNQWSRTTQPCTAGTKIITYYDYNSCPEIYDFPSDNGTYEACTTTTFIQNSLSQDIYVLIILFIFLIVSTACAIAIHEGFFLLNAFLIALLGVTFMIYGYPDVLYIAVAILIIVFVGMFIIIKNVRR